jgi:hypothetical protein
MAEKTLNTIIVLRNDSSTDWAKSDVVLKSGELGVSYLENGNVMVKAGNGEDKWSDLPQVESVLESDMMLTYSFGKHSVPAGGSLNAGGTNMTMSQWIADALKKTVEPTIKRYPNASLSASCSNTGASLEVGSYITSVSYTGSLSEDGDYETNGKESASGIKSSDLSWEVTLGDDATTKKTTATGSYTTNIQINSTTANTVYATVKAKATLGLDNVNTPTNNLGEANANVKIKGFDAAGTTVKNLTADVKASGYRNTWYYIGTDCTTPIDSAFIRKATPRNANTTNFEIDTKTPGGASFKGVKIPANTTRVMFAVPGVYNNIAVINVDGMGLPEDGFVRTEVQVEGANGFEAATYSVFTKENANGMAATGFTVSITK